MENGMYGGRTADMFGYSHFTGGFAGGQTEYVRVPYGDVNLFKLPANVPDEIVAVIDDRSVEQSIPSTNFPGTII